MSVLITFINIELIRTVFYIFLVHKIVHKTEWKHNIQGHIYKAFLSSDINNKLSSKIMVKTTDKSQETAWNYGQSIAS